MLWRRILWLFILFLMGRHMGFPTSPRYLELADSADFFIERENWDKAEVKIMEALRLEPANFTNSMLLANLGLVQTHKGEYKKAIESLSLGLNIAPKSTVILNNRAHTFLLLDNIADATSDIDKSLEIDSIQEWTLQTRGFIYLQAGETQNAKRVFSKLKKEFPNNFSVYAGLAAIAEQEGDLNQAISYYNEALKGNPEDEEAHEAYIFVLIKNNDYTSARSEIRKAIDLNPENPMFYLLRGYLHRLNYRLDEAVADKNLAISKGLDPQYVESFIP